MEYTEMHPGQRAIINAAQNALNGQAELERKAALHDWFISGVTDIANKYRDATPSDCDSITVEMGRLVRDYVLKSNTGK